MLTVAPSQSVVVPVRERVLRASVTVSGPCNTGCHGTVLGAGILIGRRDDGTLIVVTARHIARSVATLRVSMYDGDTSDARRPLRRASGSREAELLATSSTSDLALFAVRSLPSDAVTIAPFTLETASQNGSVIGAPYGHLWNVSTYRFASADTDGSFVVHCPTCGPGDSGGGVFDPHGRLAGVLVSERRIVERGEPPALAQQTSDYRVIGTSAIRSLLATSRRIRSPRIEALSAEPWSRFDAPRNP